MPTYRNHPKAHWFDAARMLRSAAAKIVKAADAADHPEAARKLLSFVDSQIEAATMRLKDR